MHQSRSDDVQYAFRLEWLTVVWMMLEGAGAVFAGIKAQSLTLIAFGVDSGIELLSASVLLWRLSVELKRGQEFSEVAEKRAGQIGGGLLLALALYVIVSALWSFWVRQGAEFSLFGLILALGAIPIMFFLSKAKLRIAEAIGSRALRADAFESIACGYLSFVVVLGLIAELVFHVWWVDGATSLIIVYFLIKEGIEAWRGEEDGEDDEKMPRS